MLLCQYHQVEHTNIISKKMIDHYSLWFADIVLHQIIATPCDN